MFIIAYRRLDAPRVICSHTVVMAPQTSMDRDQPMVRAISACKAEWALKFQPDIQRALHPSFDGDLAAFGE